MGNNNGKHNQAAPPTTVRVLLIDNDEEHTRLLREYINEASGSLGAFVMEAADNLHAGLGMAASGKYDVVLLGLMLPDSRGLDTYYRLRSQSPNLPIIALADIRHESVAMESMRQGAQDYLIKGTVDARFLKHVIRYAILEAHIEDTVQRIRNPVIDS